MDDPTDGAKIELTEREVFHAHRVAKAKWLRGQEQGIDLPPCPPDEAEYCCVGRLYYGPEPGDFIWGCVLHQFDPDGPLQLHPGAWRAGEGDGEGDGGLPSA
jgi:hypothetical protein